MAGNQVCNEILLFRAVARLKLLHATQLEGVDGCVRSLSKAMTGMMNGGILLLGVEAASFGWFGGG